MKKPTYQYPRNSATGSIPQYVSSALVGQTTVEKVGRIEWHVPAPIETEPLLFQDFERGRSAAHAVFIVEAPNKFICKYTVFLTDLGDLLRSDVMKGRWWYPPRGLIMPCKRGTNYGVRALSDAEYKALT